MMNACLRSAGCPAAERNILTGPIAGATSNVTPFGVKSPIAQPRCPRDGDRAVLLRRRRLVRDDFLGVKFTLHSHCSGRVSGRPSVDVWCNPPAGLTRVCRRIRLHELAESQARAVGCEKTLENHSASAVRPLDFRDHVDVRPFPPPRSVPPRTLRLGRLRQ